MCQRAILIDHQSTKRAIFVNFMWGVVVGDSGVKDYLDCTPEVLGLEGAIGSSRASGGQICPPDGGHTETTPQLLTTAGQKRQEMCSSRWSYWIARVIHFGGEKRYLCALTRLCGLGTRLLSRRATEVGKCI